MFWIGVIFVKFYSQSVVAIQERECPTSTMVAEKRAAKIVSIG